MKLQEFCDFMEGRTSISSHGERLNKWKEKQVKLGIPFSIPKKKNIVDSNPKTMTWEKFKVQNPNPIGGRGRETS